MIYEHASTTKEHKIRLKLKRIMIINAAYSWPLAMVEYSVCQYSTHCDSNLLRNRASKLDAMSFATHKADFGGTFWKRLGAKEPVHPNHW